MLVRGPDSGFGQVMVADGKKWSTAANVSQQPVGCQIERTASLAWYCGDDQLLEYSHQNIRWTIYFCEILAFEMFSIYMGLNVNAKISNTKKLIDVLSA